MAEILSTVAAQLPVELYIQMYLNENYVESERHLCAVSYAGFVEETCIANNYYLSRDYPVALRRNAVKAALKTLFFYLGKLYPKQLYNIVLNVDLPKSNGFMMTLGSYEQVITDYGASKLESFVESLMDVDESKSLGESEMYNMIKGHSLVVHVPIAISESKVISAKNLYLESKDRLKDF